MISFLVHCSQYRITDFYILLQKTHQVYYYYYYYFVTGALLFHISDFQVDRMSEWERQTGKLRERHQNSETFFSAVLSLLHGVLTVDSSRVMHMAKQELSPVSCLSGLCKGHI